MTEVGRNEPCPCGSGAKYKYCCLRKKKKGAVNDDLSGADGWQGRLARAVNQGYEAAQRDESREAAQLWLDGWDDVRAEIPAEVSTLASLERACDGERSLVSWVYTCLDVLRRVGPDDPAMAERGAQFVAQLLAQCPGESKTNQRNLRGDRGWLLAAADRWDAATEEFERLIEDFPDCAVGYVRWSDAIIDFDHRNPARSVELLERAANRPVDDGAAWSLEMRLEEAREIADSSANAENIDGSEEPVDSTADEAQNDSEPGRNQTMA